MFFQKEKQKKRKKKQNPKKAEKKPVTKWATACSLPHACGA
jgi:hypothetical protein